MCVHMHALVYTITGADNNTGVDYALYSII